MATKAIRQIKYSDTLVLSECSDGFFLYDYSRGMNVAMRAKTETAALVEALMYYQRRTSDVEKEWKELKQKVNSFLEQFEDEEGEIHTV